MSPSLKEKFVQIGKIGADMVERLQEIDGNYRFLIPGEGRLVIGTPTDIKYPNHQEIAEALGLDPQQIKGGFVEIWEEGTKMAYCGGAFSIPEASEEDFAKARTGEIVIFQPKGRIKHLTKLT